MRLAEANAQMRMGAVVATTDAGATAYFRLRGDADGPMPSSVMRCGVRISGSPSAWGPCFYMPDTEYTRVADPHYCQWVP